jgi:dTDP-4-dehydrorhamnose reductase
VENERIFIVGCGGMLGGYVYNEFKNNNELYCCDKDANEDWIKPGDIRDHAFLFKVFNEFKPTIVINLSALTDLEYCDANEEETYDTNSFSAEVLAEMSHLADIPYVFISTAGIFDGEKDYYNEFDPAYPLGAYGNSKHHVETFLNGRITKYYAIRAGWMFGGGKKDKKFISKITKQIKAGKKELFVVDDKLGTPTYTKDFAKSLKNILEKQLPYGVYNSVSKGDASRYETAVKLIELLDLDIKVTKVDSNYFKEEYSSARPASEKLINMKLDILNENIMRDWEDALTDYVKNGSYNEI